MSTWFIAFCGTRTGVFCTTVVLGELTGGDRQAADAIHGATTLTQLKMRKVLTTLHLR
jgi:hypothetical protein